MEISSHTGPNGPQEEKFETTLSDLASILIREGHKQKVVVFGVMLDVNSKTEPVRVFTNTKDKGSDLAQLFREVADLYEKKALAGGIVTKNPHMC